MNALTQFLIDSLSVLSSVIYRIYYIFEYITSPSLNQITDNVLICKILKCLLQITSNIVANLMCLDFSVFTNCNTQLIDSNVLVIYNLLNNFGYHELTLLNGICALKELIEPWSSCVQQDLNNTLNAVCCVGNSIPITPFFKQIFSGYYYEVSGIIGGVCGCNLNWNLTAPCLSN